MTAVEHVVNAYWTIKRPTTEERACKTLGFCEKPNYDPNALYLYLEDTSFWLTCR